VCFSHRPPEGATRPAAPTERPADPSSKDSCPRVRDTFCVVMTLHPPPPGAAPPEEPLFSRLRSPAHRRTAALLLLASSGDESSSLASRSRSVSPLRSKHRALLLGLSTGMFDANNPQVRGGGSLLTRSQAQTQRPFITLRTCRENPSH